MYMYHMPYHKSYHMSQYVSYFILFHLNILTVPYQTDMFRFAFQLFYPEGVSIFEKVARL